MNKKLLFAAVLMASLFTACSSDHDEEVKTLPSIKITTQIEGTRVSTQSDGTQIFDDGDQISVYAWTGDANTIPASGSRVVDNSINTLSGTTWTANPQMLWTDFTSPHYFIGIYPSSTTTVADLTAMPYSLDVDAGKINHTPSNDLLIATNLNGLLASNSAVPLVFDHVMGKININLTFRNQFEGHPNVEKVVVKDAMTSALVNCLTKTVTATGEKTDITMHETSVAGQFTTIFVPQSGIRTIVITIDGKDYTFTHTEDIGMDGGKYTTINLIVGKDEITLGSVSINDWQKGTEITGGEAQTN